MGGVRGLIVIILIVLFWLLNGRNLFFFVFISVWVSGVEKVIRFVVGLVLLLLISVRIFFFLLSWKVMVVLKVIVLLFGIGIILVVIWCVC